MQSATESVLAPEQFPRFPILLIDDEAPFLLSESLTLTAAGINHVVSCQDSRRVLALLSSQEFQLIVMDMSMPHVTGWELLPQVVAAYPHIPVVILSAFDEVKLAVQSMKDGAFDYLVKPVDDSRLVTTVKRAIDFRELQNENSHLKHSLLSGELAHPEAFDAIVTGSRPMRAIFQYIEAIAQTPLPVLITGETGVGKELIGNAIHALSGRRGQMVSVNMAGLDDNLFSDTLFGHKRGGFTGADWERKGLVEQAAHGTLFLDEIGDLSMESQVKLLRLLQEGKYFPIGSDIVKFTDARFVAATNSDLNAKQQNGRFRKDLYYRLSAHRVDIPPLRKRREDIPLLVHHFLERAAAVLGKKKPTPPKELFTLLENHLFAGNVRELEGMILDIVSQHKGGVLSIEAIRTKVDPSLSVAPLHSESMSSVGDETHDRLTNGQSIQFSDRLPTLLEAEHLVIEEAMKRSKGNQRIAAQMLGVSRRALNNRLCRAR